MVSEAGIHTHIATDQTHCFEDGGLNCHTQFTTWEHIPGHMATEATRSQPLTFDAGLAFIDAHARHDNRMVHIETLAPHEPCITNEHCKALYPGQCDHYGGPMFDRPWYGRTDAHPAEAEHLFFD